MICDVGTVYGHENICVICVSVYTLDVMHIIAKLFNEYISYLSRFTDLTNCYEELIGKPNATKQGEST